MARRLGVAPATLRTWDRRYGLGPSEHLAGSHRRYSDADVSRLLVMRRLTLEGVAPSEAAQTALASAEAGAEAGAAHRPSVTEVVDAYSDAVPMAADPHALVAAAVHFDNAAVRWMLARVQARDVLAWWSELVAPALEQLAAREAVEGPGEHAAPALTAAAFAELRSRAAVATARAGDDDSRQTVLVIPAGTEAGLVAHVLAAALQDHGVRARVLSGQQRPGVADVVEQLQPAAVLVHVSDTPGADVVADGAMQAVVAADLALPVFMHRQGTAHVELPASGAVHRVRTLTGALHEILAVLG